MIHFVLFYLVPSSSFGWISNMSVMHACNTWKTCNPCMDVQNCSHHALPIFDSASKFHSALSTTLQEMLELLVNLTKLLELNIISYTDIRHDKNYNWLFSQAYRIFSFILDFSLGYSVSMISLPVFCLRVLTRTSCNSITGVLRNFNSLVFDLFTYWMFCSLISRGIVTSNNCFLTWKIYKRAWHFCFISQILRFFKNSSLYHLF